MEGKQRVVQRCCILTIRNNKLVVDAGSDQEICSPSTVLDASELHQYLESLVHGALLLAAEALSMLVIQRLL